MKTFGKIFVLMAIVLFSPKAFALAGLEINEIMYDLETGSDEGREWVEVYNNGNEPVDFSTYRFFEADTNHKLISIVGGRNIPPLGYALIISDAVKFKTDWPAFVGIIFDSTFSLSNTGEVLMLKDKDLNIVDQRSYSSIMGATGDGKTLQLVGGSWVASRPTPGAENKFFKPVPKVAPKTETKPKEIVSQSETVEIKKSVSPNLEQNLASQSGGVDNSKASQTSQTNSNIFVFIFMALILFCACFVYFLRRKKKIFTPGDNFEILDE